MKFKITKTLTQTEIQQVHLIWNQEFPSNLKKETLSDFEKFLDSVSEHKFIVATDDSNKIMGWFFIFLREDEKWFSILVDSQYHGMSVGSQLIDQAKTIADVLNGWVVDHQNDVKIDGSPYPSPIPFYLKNGFEVLNDRLEKDDISAVKVRWVKSK